MIRPEELEIYENFEKYCCVFLYNSLVYGFHQRTFIQILSCKHNTLCFWLIRNQANRSEHFFHIFDGVGNSSTQIDADAVAVLSA